MKIWCAIAAGFGLLLWVSLMSMKSLGQQTQLARELKAELARIKAVQPIQTTIVERAAGRALSLQELRNELARLEPAAPGTRCIDTPELLLYDRWRNSQGVLQVPGGTRLAGPQE